MKSWAVLLGKGTGSYLLVTAVSRRISTGCSNLWSKYNSKVFREPVVSLEQLYQPLDPKDDRRYCYLKAMTSAQTPVFYRNAIIDRLINVCMLRGMKEKMRTIILEALEIVKRRQHRLWMNTSAEDRSKIELDPTVITEIAIKNCSPVMILRPFIRGYFAYSLGGQTYMVPCPLSQHHAEFRAMKTMRDICRQKTFHGATHFEFILADELLAAYRNEGLTVQAKQELHKHCEANRAYVHYRRQ
ncbi:unnamed protein product [Thelazia callipaeda]|uniref:Ribosomal_S7 domain-containing protein n=1 Tax=Thelazia callipaeda TaxID=103827 RepID=A0A0N5CLJ0_THECL|nr:unnamed protein product [Thelazia callipaeda]